MKKINRNRQVMPIYRESGYARMLPKVSSVERWLRLGALLLLAVSCVLLLVARDNSRWVELYYSNGFYAIWAGSISAITSLIPFSLGEWLIIIFALCVLAMIAYLVVQLVSYKRQCTWVLGRFFIRALSIASVLFTLFILSGGLNYYRYHFVEYTDLEVRPSETSELAALCNKLVGDANAQRTLLTEDDSGVVVSPDSSPWRLGSKANDSYKALVNSNEELQGVLRLATRVRPKPVLFSETMSYMQIAGVYFPYTVEANVNVHTADYTIPATMCHELAHVAGFMREDEANYIAYKACLAGGDSFFNYSGTMLALVYSANALNSHDVNAYRTVMSGLSEPVVRDMQSYNAYLTKYDTSFGDFATAVNDSYLKANDQTDGVESYGQMVDLLLADFRKSNN